MAEDFYDVLDVSEDATQEEITAAYREKVKEYHPDQSDREDASDRFKEVVDAEEVLGDEDERERYDRIGHAAYVGTETVEETTPTPEDVEFDGVDWEAASRDPSDGWWESHHARHRRRRDRQTSAWEWAEQSSGATAGASTPGAKTGGSATGGTASNSARGTATSGANPRQAGGGSSFAVTDSSTDPSSGGFLTPALTQETVFLVAVSLLIYPMLLVSTIVDLFLFPIRVTTGVLLFLTAGYLLTVPGIGVLVFGTLSVFVPAILFTTGLLFPLTMRVVFAVLLIWIPFGYAVAVASVVGR
ncbi:DnaJ domain-containing protein [Natranaeroarchaeum aerophilus]|uniref:DnaJ domain-containing protein n=1 Tax=Natranaeroarchaeum aerophilus TaxID=2917711 RepID=A0AAE3K5N6_9EURY|nr:DnaJ domain-containing protein [Natranaeroarchaeum aerophilus]MCL9814121.1 DnaJ domain-containing protein [Natranaeroarchaeum aerophilus]